jgi:crotonobetainyl-CoA:carnitine CoA-transferase CaiB-like acyl-CoA transferase
MTDPRTESSGSTKRGEPDGGGPLAGVRVIELASDHAAFAGKLLADYGAEVVLVEPPGGHPSRRYGPFAGDQPGVERSLWWWHYQTSKRSVVLDLDDAADRARLVTLVATADIVLEGEAPGYLGERSIDYPDLRPTRTDLVWVSLTPYGRRGPRSGDVATDLTVLADGGPMWNCGYDDHSIPPVRGGGNQGYQTGSLFAVMSALTAWLYRAQSGIGQFVDVSMHAAANVTTEAGSYEYLVGRNTVQRMTGRHAGLRLTTSSMAPAADGRVVHTGVPPRAAREFVAVLDWLDELGWRQEFAESFFLEIGADRGGVSVTEIHSDPEAQAIFNAGRECLRFLAERLPAYAFFLGAQRRGLSTGIVYAPEEVLVDPHFIARGFPVEVDRGDGTSITHLGLPIAMRGSPGCIGRAPLLGEHQHLLDQTTETS